MLSTLNARYSHSSLALRYLRSYCRQRFDAGASPRPEIRLAEYTINEPVDFVLGELCRLEPDLLGLSVYIWNLHPTLVLCSKLKKVAPRTFIVLGGPEVSGDAEQLLRDHPSLDVVVSGEGEETFWELVRELLRRPENPDFSPISGLAFRQHGQVVANPPRRLMTDLDQIPSPYQEMAVQEGEREELRDRVVYFESSRGCPYECIYCLSSRQPGVRYFSLPRVKADLEALVEAGMSKIKLVDRTFNCRPDRAHEIWEYLIERHHQDPRWRRVKFHFEIGGDRLNRESQAILKRVPAGFFEFEIGVQSTNRDTLRAIRRRMDWEKLRQAVKELRQYDRIHLHLDLIAGLPCEDYSSFRRSFNDVYALRPHRLQLGFLKLLKGTEMREAADRYSYRYSDYPPYEVLGHCQLSFREILRLRTIEDLLEKYYNSGRFNNSLAFLEQWGNDAMGLYEAMADFWEDAGYHRSAHSSQSLYKILYRFGEHWREICQGGQKGESGVEAEVYSRTFSEMLLFDYLLQPGMQSHPDWTFRAQLENRRQIIRCFLQQPGNIERWFPEFLGQSAREVNKRLYFEVFSFNVVELAEEIGNRLRSGEAARERQPSLPKDFEPTLVGFTAASPKRVVVLSRKQQ